MSNKREQAEIEVRTVLREWLDTEWDDIVATKVVDRLIEQGLIQSTDPNELAYRTGPLEPGRKIVGGS